MVSILKNKHQPRTMEVKRTYVPRWAEQDVCHFRYRGNRFHHLLRLTDTVTSSPTQCNGLRGSMTVAKTGILVDIGSVHYDPRAGLSVISASAWHEKSHQREFKPLVRCTYSTPPIPVFTTVMDPPRPLYCIGEDATMSVRTSPQEMMEPVAPVSKMADVLLSSSRGTYVPLI